MLYRGQYDESWYNWSEPCLFIFVDELHHTDQVIDVLKIDVEGTEWQVVEDLLKSGVLR